MTTTGSAPTDSYVPIAYDGQNYKTSAGNLLESNEISFRADCPAGQNIPTATTTQVAFNNEVFDVGGKFDTSTYRFTPGVAGRYLLTATVLLRDIGHSSGPIGAVYIVKNAVVIAALKDRVYTSGNDANLTVTVITEANDTDYFYVAVYQNFPNASTKPLSGTDYETWFAGCKI